MEVNGLADGAIIRCLCWAAAASSRTSRVLFYMPPSPPTPTYYARNDVTVGGWTEGGGSWYRENSRYSNAECDVEKGVRFKIHTINKERRKRKKSFLHVCWLLE